MSNLLTAEQLDCWHKKGFLHLKNMISVNELKNYLSVVDKVIERSTEPSDVQRKIEDSKGAYKILRAIEKTSGIDSLIDHPNIFPIILELMGPYLQVMSTELFVRHPDEQHIIRFHTDAGPSMQKILPTSTNLPLQFKVQLFLTDLSKPNSGNFSFFPGTHLKYVSEETPGCFIPEANVLLDQGIFPPDAHQLIAEPGDVVIFPWSLWHGVSPNLTSTIRKSISLRYGQLWCRPHDYERLSPEILQRLTLRQRRLFGDLGNYEGYEPSDYYRPKDQLSIMYN
jgi:ectoine hydroxylase-related dioxygenase (phytanoyl-CoA dioxygenase family)